MATDKDIIDIIIIISEIGDARILKTQEELIQREARDKFIKLIDHRLETINNLINKENKYEHKTDVDCKPIESILCDNDCDSDSGGILNRHHDTILIEGERGTGKTTFALNMFEYIKEKNKISNIGILDPTLIENKEHILINIISKIKKKIECFFVYCKKDKIDYEYYNVWKKQLVKLAAGLSLLDGVGGDRLKSELWDSPELAMEEGIDNSVSGQELEKDFHKFIELSLKILCQDAFILFLDDIDTSIDKGFVIMEVLRKYLTSPRLIIVLLGNIKLYSLIVKQLQYEKIDPKKILKEYLLCICIEGKHIDNEQIKGYIDILQDQYLTKILKPEFRITLRSIYDYIDKIKVKRDSNSNSENNDCRKLEDVLKDFCKRVFSLKEKEIKEINAITEFMSKLPTRTFLQLLKTYYILHYPNKHLDKMDFINGLKNIFVAYFDDNFLKEQNIGDKFIINRISEFLINIENADSEDIYKLLPFFRDIKKNVSMFIVNAVSSYILQEKPHRLIEYMIKLYLPKYCAYATDSMLFIDEKSRIKTVTDYLSIETDEESMNIAKKAVVFFEGTTNLEGFISGFIHVNKTINKEKDIMNKHLFLNIVLFRIRYIKSNSFYLFGSFFSVLSLMSEILSLASIEDTADIAQIKGILLKHSEIKTYESLFNQDQVSQINEAESKSDDKNTADFNNIENLDIFCSGLAKWSKNIENLDQASIPMLNKIWSNFTSNLDDIDENLGNNKDMNFASILHRYGVAFLNSVFVESQPEATISRQNPVTDDGVFSKKIESFCKDKALMDLENNRISLFNFIFSCPLWGVYLDIIDINSADKNISDYFLKLQQEIFGKEKEDIIINIFTPLTIIDTAKNINFSETTKTKAANKVDFKKLSLNAKAQEVKRAMNLLKISENELKSTDFESIKKYIYKIRREIQQGYAPRTVPAKTIREIVERLLKK